jgi:MFS family permease
MQRNAVAATDLVTAKGALGILALCFFFNFVSRGVGDTYMVFLLPLEAQFGWQRSQMTSVYSALMLTSGIASPLAGMVFERFGPRVLYLGGVVLLALGYLTASRAQELWHFYLGVGLLGGLGGSALGMVPASAILSWWFRDRLSTAIGIAYAGFGCGSLVMVPLAQSLIDASGWRGAYQAIGIVLVVLGVLALLLPWGRITAARPEPVLRAAGVRTASPLRTALRQRRFWLLVQVMFFTAVGMYLVTVQSVAYLVHVGFTPLQAAGAFGAAGMLSVVGVSSAGWLSDRYSHKKAATVSFIGTSLGIAMLYALSYRASEWLLVGYVLLFGICQGARGPLVAGLTARLYAGAGQATVYGAIYACMSVGAGLGALLAGVLHDLTGGYRATFVLAIACVLLAAAPFWTSRDTLVPAGAAH